MKNKWKLLLSTLMTALPIAAVFLWSGSFMPDIGNGWHFSWILPSVLVVLNVFLHVITDKDAERTMQNKKIMNISYWILPLISIFVTATFVMIFLGATNFIGTLVSLTFGTLFIVIGNYLPKAVRNRWFGIKISWTLASDENWIATHRISGKIFFIGGFVALFGAFLPDMWGLFLMIAVISAAVIIPIVYSYRLYKKHMAEGTGNYDFTALKRFGKEGKTVAVVLVVLTVALILLVCFTGNIKYTVGEETLDVKGGGSSVSIDYDDIKTAELRYEKVDGTRIMGYGSLNMLAGWFENDEFGGYTRFTYGKSDATIVIFKDDGVIVLSCEDTAATEKLYNTISDKMLHKGEWK